MLVMLSLQVQNQIPNISPEELTYLQSFMLEGSIARFKEMLEERTRHLTIVMDNVVDPYNISAVMRTAECFGIQDLHLLETDRPFKAARKIQRGSVQWVDLYKYKPGEESALQCIRQLKDKGFKIVATTPHTRQQSVAELDITQPIALVLGQERDGVSELMKQHADEFVVIPMQGFTESLNISVAASIMIYELNKRLRESSINYHLSEKEKFNIMAKWTYNSLENAEGILKNFEF